MGEAIKNLVVLVWTVSAINSGADAKVVSEYRLEEERKQQKVSIVLNDKNTYSNNKRNLLSVNNF